ncbi:uncharacterized protein LOC126884257 [Diabrotica virgifera virgifera]|uniref:HAT C-terminal dimerisation domain-containing protein n=1 Tax=Diabrotica virgifera virgifera TaxID=50390 RepID=A0ABM5K7I1_DIAVI|nr:uncharacterized protein LOC126884257 [Diabrotica virgifera virgifera]
MKAAWALIENDFDNNIFTYGCFAHSLNLIFTDLKNLTSLKSFIAEAVALTKAIRQSHILSAWVKEKQNELKISCSLKLPVPTRWGSLDRVQGYIMLLEPIANTITSVEGDTPTISKCLHLFKKMVNTSLENVTKSPLLSKEEADTRAIFENRKKFAIYSVHFVANLLDPKYRGCELSSDEMTDATEVIYKVAQKMPVVVVNFIAKEGLFKKAFLWNEDTIAAISPIAWWSGLCSNTALSKLAIRFLELPATSAACERSFSSYSGIHTNKRNRLTNTRASKSCMWLII